MNIFHDPSGKPSMSRTLAFILVCVSTLFTLVIAYAVLRKIVDAAEIGACASVIGALIGGGAVALIKRHLPPGLLPSDHHQ